MAKKLSSKACGSCTKMVRPCSRHGECQQSLHQAKVYEPKCHIILCHAPIILHS